LYRKKEKKSMHSISVRFLLSLGMIVVLTATGCGLTAAGGPDVPATLPPALAQPTSPPTSTAVPHLATPGSGVDAVANAHDNEESETAAEKNVRSGDEFRINRFERPFTANEMEYLPQIDIVGMSMTQDDTWYYVQVKLVGTDPATGELSGLYGVEFDLNVDGKTEVLLLAQGPIGSAWSAEGVALYADLNGDIGGTSSRPDDIYAGNGYESKVYESGQVLMPDQGDDPDLAWVRSSKDNAIVEIAMKKSVLKDYAKWMWNPLASAYPLDPTKFYFNDTFSEERAGSPNKGSEFYPVKGLAGFDNTCRVPANFQPTGSEPMGCQVSKPQGDLEFEGGGGYPG
jgi:hypothetical protein